MIRLGLVAAAASLAGVIVAVLRPGDATLAVDALVLFLGALAIGALALHAQRHAPPSGRSAIEAALDVPRPPPARPAELVRLERKVVLGVTNVGDLNASLAPVLRGIAIPLLAGRGVDLESDPDGARALLGDDAWELLRADVPRPENPFAPGVSEERLAAVVTRLEELRA